MKQKHLNILIGGLAGILVAGIIIFAIEEQKSFLQILFGFLLFVVPFAFISSFGSKVGSFVFVFFTTIATYIVSKYVYHDFWLGVLLALIIGGSAFYFRVKPYKPFNPTEYKQMAKENIKNKENDA